VDVDDAVNQLKLQKPPIRAVVIGAYLSGRGKVHREDARSLSAMIYSNVSFVGSTALAEELKLLGHATPTA
jgi:hypothetical protein